MKKPFYYLFVLIVMYSFSSVAQTLQFHQHALPEMLNNWPDSFGIPSLRVRELMSAREQSSHKVLLGNNMWLDIVFVKKQIWSDGSETYAYTVSNLPEGTMLNINKTYKDERPVYRAHIVNHKYSDSYQLTSYNEREFIFTKTDTENIVAE
jgi:hypothetical protein